MVYWVRLGATYLHIDGLHSQDKYYQAHQLTSLIQMQGQHLFPDSSSKRLFY